MRLFIDSILSVWTFPGSVSSEISQNLLKDISLRPTFGVDGDLSVTRQHCELIGPLRFAEKGHVIGG